MRAVVCRRVVARAAACTTIRYTNDVRARVVCIESAIAQVQVEQQIQERQRESEALSVESEVSGTIGSDEPDEHEDEDSASEDLHAPEISGKGHSSRCLGSGLEVRASTRS